MEPLNIAVLASGGGTNLQALIDAGASGQFAGQIRVVISNRGNAYALTRAQDQGIASEVLRRRDHASDLAYDAALLELLDRYDVDLVVLAGYLRVLTPPVIQAYRNRIINVHPSLLPAFGGDGMYGAHVHEAVYARGVKVSGATVHFVDEGTDTGPIILQRAIDLPPQVGPEAIASLVLEVEHQLLPLAVKLYCDGLLQVDGKHVAILSEPREGTNS